MGDLDGWINEWVNGWINGLIGWVNGWTNEGVHEDRCGYGILNLHVHVWVMLSASSIILLLTYSC